MQTQKPKLASFETQMERGKGMVNALFFFLFVFVLSLPLLNILAGFAIVLYMPMLIFARSAQRAADCGWLLLGACLCIFGFFLPAIFEGPTSSGFFHGWLLEVILNAAVGWFILARRLGHLFTKPNLDA
jgi:hypothetical protein